VRAINSFSGRTERLLHGVPTHRSARAGAAHDAGGRPRPRSVVLPFQARRRFSMLLAGMHPPGRALPPLRPPAGGPWLHRAADFACFVLPRQSENVERRTDRERTRGRSGRSTSS